MPSASINPGRFAAAMSGAITGCLQPSIIGNWPKSVAAVFSRLKVSAHGPLSAGRSDTIHLVNFSLSTHVLMAHWVPGFVLVMAVRAILLDGSSMPLKNLTDAPGDAITTLSVVVAAAFVGEFLDALRDLLEHVWDRFTPIQWDYLAKSGKDEVDNLRTWYYTYYVFDCNAILALIIAFVTALYRGFGNGLVVLIVLTFLGVFFFNAKQLRREIASLTKEKS